ncbi:metalloendopeptidase-like membrane protein [Salinisphaera dokdonensis CL-ES53]|uniref:Metalloendopeptidase-like membrane protein n=1 Tax=Salinisphaera dokdonensis CL-ES53 TaxID=1304272 RepID=A0ABV2B0G3_9GAMM
MNDEAERDPAAPTHDRGAEPVTTEEHNPTPDAEAPAKRQRARWRPWLLLLMLAALIGLLSQRPELRRDALETTRTAVMDGLNISPRAIYTLRLRIAGLEDSALGQRWRSAVDRAGADPRRFTTRYATRDEFAADRIEAHVYETSLKRGERFEIRLRRDTPCESCRSALYVSLERRAADSDDATDWTTVATLDADGHTESRVVDRDGDYRVVLQPELAAEASYEIAMARGGSIPFPVEGAGQRDIGSGFGAPRDGGARQHHGVDIFAERGTPVRAVTAGRVRTGSGGIGGKHVWLSSGMLGIGGARYYYAHLDEFAVDASTSVEAGDVIGYVGNTGNARTTPPHLHFGIYTGFGPVDPAPFLGAPPDLPGT